MSGIVFLPGFDGDATLREEFVRELGRGHAVRPVSYPNHVMGSLDAYRLHAMAQAPVDWRPVLVAESFGGLVAARWAAVDSRVQALVLCGSFARNPAGAATAWGAFWPGLVKLGPFFANPLPAMSKDPRRRRWSEGFRRSLGALRDDVVSERLRLIATEDTGPALRQLRVPVLLVQFEDDLVILPHAREHLESVCHNPHVLRLPGPHFAIETRPVESARAITAKLAALLPKRA